MVWQFFFFYGKNATFEFLQGGTQRVFLVRVQYVHPIPYPKLMYDRAFLIKTTLKLLFSIDFSFSVQDYIQDCTSMWRCP